MKKILITGLSGFVGKYLAEQLLKNDNQIIGTYHSDSSLARLESLKERVTLEKIDLQEGQAVNDLMLKHSPDLIFHLAAQSSPSASFQDPQSTIITNILPELYLLESLKKNNLEHTRIMITSTSEVYGLIKKEDLPTDEETPLNPVSPYAVSKIAQDYLGLQYFYSHKLNVIRVRPFNHIGPGQREQFVVAAFAKQIAEIEKGKKEPILKVGNLEKRRDFTDVRDMVKAYELAGEKGQAGEVYNIGSGQSHSIQEIVDILLGQVAQKITVEQDASLMRSIDTPDVIADCSKFSSMTGWKPEIPFEQTIKDILDYWRSIV